MFTHSDYINFLNTISKTTKTHLFKNFTWNVPGLILRHDVDISIDYCLRLVEKEYDLGIVSTNFIMVTSPLYNPLALNNTRSLQKIVELGSEVALHFDPTCYPGASNEELLACVVKEAAVLENIIDQKICSISLHCPSIHGQFPVFKNYINAYDPSFFSDENYISDSCMSFRGKDPLEWLHLSKTKPVQMLLHPLHYQTESPNYQSIFENFINQRNVVLNDLFTLSPAFVRDIGKFPLFNINTIKKS
ncbi:hypothetical protein [Maridesulfovibrio ferrireducens]|uniref:hypothetical protein n=1 Tax=Maridesulfovibrio ferrireducens TaxID=246191 RepID=UPI001A286DDA|nr:hypothetical protein [Maridesulfovibrio ferrireducens]MBI9112705.1 hypothetical protein [Maridesulfovibrio ferrireducens]